MILGIDQGTTGSRAFIFDEHGKVVTSSYSEFEQHFPRPGWVEHDAAEIWEVTRKVCHQALDEAGIDGSKLKAIGITNQRETAVAWDRGSGEPLHRAIVWQDRRTAKRCDRLRAEGYESMFRERTGLVLDAYFSGTKYEWMIKEGGVSPDAAFGTIDAWLLYKLTGRHATDYSNASRTLLFNIRELAWDADLCDTLGVPVDSLPEPVRNAEVLGETTEFGGKVPVAAMVGDQQGALYGQACLEPGLGKNTYGTGSFVLLNAGARTPPAPEGLLTTVAWRIGNNTTYALEAAIFVTGAAVQWLRDGLGIIAQAADTEPLAASLDTNDGVYFVPALTGLGSPYWDPYARGTIVGLTRGNGRAHLARATLEAIAYQAVDAIRAMERVGAPRLTELKADGGATVNRWLMQFQADVLGVPVVVPEVPDTTALGAAYLAGVGVGLWTIDAVGRHWRERERYEPRMGEAEREELLDGWHRAVERAGAWAR
jgi:glycerol kinase